MWFHRYPAAAAQALRVRYSVTSARMIDLGSAVVAL
jgi:hypothetical protein